MTLQNCIKGAVEAINNDKFNSDRYSIFINGESWSEERFLSVEFILRYHLNEMNDEKILLLHEIWVTTHEVLHGEDEEVNDKFVVSTVDTPLNEQVEKANSFFLTLPDSFEELKVSCVSTNRDDVYDQVISLK